MKGNHMKDVQEIIAELQRRGPIDETEFYRVEGPTPSPSLVRSALVKISGDEGLGGYRYYCTVLEHCGCHPEEGASKALIMATERARQMLVIGPKNRTEMDNILKKYGF